jgi:hypothetical protein
MKEESLLRRFYNYILRTRTMVVVNILVGVGLLFFVLFLFLQQASTVIQFLSLLLFSFFIGLSGLVIIIKREVNYTIISFDGFPAIIYGSIILIAGSIAWILLFTNLLRFLIK